jgi:hypothetical protein
MDIMDEPFEKDLPSAWRLGMILHGNQSHHTFGGGGKPMRIKEGCDGACVAGAVMCAMAGVDKINPADTIYAP